MQEAAQLLNDKHHFFQELKDNRVLKMALLQIDFGELEKRCRYTPNGLVSCHDLIVNMFNLTTAEATKEWYTIGQSLLRRYKGTSAESTY